MIQSMTGFGKSSCELDDKVVNIEIKSLNSKQLDVYMRLTGNFREKEMEIRNELTNRLKRGKVEVLFSVEYKEGRQANQINAAIVKDYYNQLRTITEEIGIAGQEPLLQAVLRLPETFNNGKESIDPDEWAKLQQALSKALEELEQFRIQEGRTLENDVVTRIKRIELLLAGVEPFEKERYESLVNKMKASLLELVPQERIDNNRFEQELIYYIEKLDISEEKTRLQHHCTYFREVISEPEQVGRKLGFVAQEIGREINTIGSKANHSGIQKIVVLMKDELEKVKEQLMNVL